MLGTTAKPYVPYPVTTMPRASLDVEIPADAWMHDVSTALPAVTFRVVSALLHEGAGVGVVEIVGDEPLTALRRMDDAGDVTRLELLWSDEREALVQFETVQAPLLGLAHRAGVPLRTPFEVVGGRARWELTTTRERLGRLREQLQSAGVSFELESVRSFEERSPADVLTDRQQEVLLAARNGGYYDVPRTTTLTAVAASLGVAKATASDTLHRAEAHLVDWFVAEELGE